jgi:putative flippase GtrA
MFLLVSIFGVVINTIIVRILTSNAGLFGTLSATERLFVAKVAATSISLIWNFIGYKALVFKK